MPTITQIFTDFDLAFSSHPNTKDLAKVKDDYAVKAAIRNLILTKYYERPFHSEIGSPVTALLFEPTTPLTIHTLRAGIIDVITNFEPRVRVDSVDILMDDDTNSCNITINFTIIGVQTLQQLDITLERTR